MMRTIRVGATQSLILLLALMLAGPLKAEPSSAQVKGVIESVILSKQMVKVSHDPVEAWGWPGMKMKFAVAPDVDLTGLKEGQQVEMTIEKQDGKPVITDFK